VIDLAPLHGSEQLRILRAAGPCAMRRDSVPASVILYDYPRTVLDMTVRYVDEYVPPNNTGLVTFGSDRIGEGGLLLKTGGAA
jgi:hypothetical protein